MTLRPGRCRYADGAEPLSLPFSGALLQVSDDGEGLTRDELALAGERYATSKRPQSRQWLGSRGEALASMWNMKTYLQIYFGASYRYIRGVGVQGLQNADLNGLAVAVTFRFGRNAKVEQPDESEFEGIYIF